MEQQNTNHSRWHHWQWPHGCCKSVIGGCERILQKRKSASTNERWWRVLPLLLVCLLAGSSGLRGESTFHNDEFTKIMHAPTVSEPYYRIRTLFYDVHSWDSYFTHAVTETGHKGPALYIDGYWLCSPDYELAWPGSGRGNDEGATDACEDEDGWWGDGYTSPVIDGVTYTIKFWNPVHNKSTEKCYVDIYIFPDKMLVNKKHTIRLKGNWVINGSNNTYSHNDMDYHDYEFNGFTMSVGSPTGAMSEYGKMKISGKLLKDHGPTTVGTYDNPNTSTFADNLTSACSPAYPKGNESYTNLVLDFGDRTNYFSEESKYVQYSFNESYKVNNYSANTKLYQWYPVAVPGYIRVKSFSTPEIYDAWNKKVKLSWTTEGSNTGGTWSIYRYETSQGQSTRVEVESGIASNEVSRNVEVPEYYKSYTFDVVFIPTNGQPMSELTKSVNYTMSPTWNFTSLSASVSKDDPDKIGLVWRHPSIGDASGSHPYTLTILRSENKNAKESQWTTLKTVQVTTRDTVNSSYQDSYQLQANHTYYYKLKINVFNKDVYSEIASTKLGGTKILSFSASRGNFSTMVKLQWTVKQVGDDITNYDIYRRPLGSNDDWGSPIATMSGTASGYSYDDNMSQPGSFYEYKLLVWSPDEDGSKSEDDSRTTDGFSITSGIVSGDITYGTGSGVDGVKVTLKKQNLDGSVSSGMRSLHFAGSNKAGIVYDADASAIQKLYAKDFTVQMYLNPTFAAMASTNTNQKYFVLDSYNVFSIYIMPAATYGKYRIVTWMNGFIETGITIPGDEWTHLTVVHSHDNATLDVIVTYADLTTQKKTLSNVQINWNANALTAKEIGIGNAAAMSANNNFRGYMDEFRFFTKALTDTEIKRNFNHPLAGNESGLAIYYPMDEGLESQTKAYDFSKTGGVSNGRHATTRTPAVSSENIPSDSQLSLMAYTDSLGYFEVRGVPFSGEGTSYSVTPQLGIHEFSPASRSRYVSINSLIHNGVDFTDVSSFPVSGKVLYSGTSYPVKGVSFYVDGVVCTNNGKISESGEDGSFTISVPIGDHYIEASLAGHTFANGRYPADPDGTNQALQPFDSEIPYLEFRDTTLVNFTGRVVGGDIEGEKNVGFGLSKNNLGVVELVLTPTNEVPYLNAKKDNNGISYIANPDPVDVLSATEAINSRSWRGATIDNCKKIFIHTDSLTGEFSALVPPLEYKLEAMKVVKGGLVVGESTLIDLSNARREFSDTLYADDGSYELYTYHTSMKHAYHSPPFFNVTQEDHDDGSFGIDSYKFKDPTTNVVINDIHYIDDNGDLVYKYGFPLFVQGDPYTFLLEGYEEYINADDQSSYRVPLENVVVTIDNALSDDQAVCAAPGPVYDEEGRISDAKAGDVVNLKSNQLKLGKDGKALYRWHAGLPNVAEPYTRSISMSFEINEKPNVWNGITGCIIGDLPTGNNFVTSGPDKMTMILRDPPGTGSSAEWSTGTVTSVAKTVNDVWSDSFDGGVTFKMGIENEAITGTAVGPPGGEAIVCTTIKQESKDDLTTHILMENEGENGTTVTTTTTITEAFSTSEESDFVGAGGDVFIGQATNVIFGNARHVGFLKTDNSGTAFDIGLKDVITTGLEFGTTFNYSQSYIENSLIPNFITLRNALLTPTTQANIDSYNPVKGVGTHNDGQAAGIKYLTTLSPDDENYGEEGTYTVVIPKPTKELPDSVKTTAQLFQWSIKNGYCSEDKIDWYNTQIKNWIKNLEFNEKEKVQAYEFRNDKKKVKYVNHSFDGGSSYNYSIECQTDSTTAWDWTVKAGALIGNHAGWDFQGFGIDCDVEIQAMGGRHEAKDSTYSEISSFSYTLAEEGSDALSVDVYQYGAFGPIFRTRGGQTCNPYEDEVRTTYYMKNGEHPVIMEKTMQIEVPQIGVDVNTVSDIPTGSAANYTLRLGNASEIGEDVTYRLFFLDETNPDGAELSIDGKVLTAEGRLIKVPGSQTITKTLQLRQTQPSILKYEGTNDDKSDLFGKGIGIVFASDSQPEEIADTIFVFAYFVPSSSPVELALSNTLMNTQTGSDLRLTFSGFDRNYNNLKAFRLQYKKQGSADWTNVREYVIDPDAVGDNPNKELLPTTGATVTYTLPMGSFTDGNYLFRCLSVCSYDNGEIYRSSEEIALVKDMMRPRPLGQPEPADGILSPGDELSVTFNENFIKGMLSQENNFKVTGVLNGADIAHQTALSMQNSEVTAQTEADINLAGKDFSIDMWVNLTGGEGTLLSHGKGNAKMSVGTDAANHLVVKIDSETYTSQDAIPTGAWVFLSLSFGNGKLNATVAKDADEIPLFIGTNAVAYNGNGPLAVGRQMTGAIHELLLWDEAHDMTTALLNRSKTKNPSTRHLIGYWKMDEGEGTTIRDYSRNRHLTMGNETWYMNNVNKAVSFDGQSYLSLPAYEMSYSPSDDYAVELWMRAGQQTGEAQLLQAGEVSLWLDAEGKLKLSNGYYKYGEEQPATYDAGTISLTDNAWHHVALNVLRQGAAAVYVDGVRRLTATASNVGSIATDNIIIGARRTAITAGSDNIFDRNLKGEIDEVRVWDATLNANKLISNRKVRLTGNEDGLVAYYPFEKNVRDQFEQLVTQGTADDMINSSLTAQFTSLDPQSQGLEFSDEAPALRPKPVETNVSFNYTASDTKIVIDIDEDPATIEGCTLNFTVRYLTDENGNYSEPVMWSAFINKNQLVWAENSLSAELQQTTTNTLTATVVNKGGQQQMWTLSGLPTWIEASVENGETNPLSETEVEFTILPSAPLGRNEVTVYLTGNDNIDTPLTLNIKVTGNVPDWAVNPYDYESSMNVIGQLIIDNVASEDEDDILAAFIGEECRGIAHPQYNERYGGSYITMDIYGIDDSQNTQEVTFRAYDASTGTTYPVVNWGAANSVEFASMTLWGSYAEPIQFNAQDLMEQQLELKAGWNWISFNVAAENMTVPELFKKVADDVLTVKSQNKYLKHEGDLWGGTLNGSLTNTEMYAVQMKADRKLRVIGSRVNTPVAIYDGWNWIGYYGRQAASVGDALADLTKGNGDILKAQRGIAYWDSYEWSGSLLIMEPGLGYQLWSTVVNDPNSDIQQSFSYPGTVKSSSRRLAPSYQDAQSTQTFKPINFRRYPDNAIMTVKVVDNGRLLDNLELGVFAGDECRTAAVTNDEGIAYLTIPGNEACEMTFKIALDNEVMDVPFTFTYETDAVYGTPLYPMVISFDDADGIWKVLGDTGSDSIYDLSGRKIADDKLSNGKLNRGVYIINGQKKAVK